MYKIFEVTYNDGGWHSGDLPHFFYVAKSKEDVIANSEKYKDYLNRKNSWGGDIWIHEVSGMVSRFYFENLNDFDVNITVRKKE